MGKNSLELHVPGSNETQNFKGKTKKAISPQKLNYWKIYLNVLVPLSRLGIQIQICLYSWT